MGVSAHNVEEALQAERDGADYIGVGAVFSTNTKKNTKNVTIKNVTGDSKGRFYSCSSYWRH